MTITKKVEEVNATIDYTKFQFKRSGTSDLDESISRTVKCNASGVASFTKVPYRTAFRSISESW